MTFEGGREIRYACGHTQTTWLLATTPYEQVLEVTECQADLCLACLGKLIAQGGMEALEAHYQQIRGRSKAA